jgi:hypothetical protein
LKEALMMVDPLFDFYQASSPPSLFNPENSLKPKTGRLLFGQLV